jgi:hypothetical protein
MGVKGLIIQHSNNIHIAAAVNKHKELARAPEYSKLNKHGKPMLQSHQKQVEGQESRLLIKRLTSFPHFHLKVSTVH